jgi:hypothetical protein
MRQRAVFNAFLFSGAVALVLSGCSSSPTATTPSAKASELNFTGVWIAVGTFKDPAGPPPWSNTPWPSPPPFTPWGDAESRRLADIKSVIPCQPGGPVFFMSGTGLFPIQILEAPDQIVLQAENIAMPRRIHTDGRGHPPDLEAGWMGHSIGRWEGDVLVVDTVGTNGKTRAMNGVGANAGVSVEDNDRRFPASDQLHLVERLRVVAGGEILEDQITINDPKTYTSPIILKRYWQKRPDLNMMEYYCGENPRPKDEANLPAGETR